MSKYFGTDGFRGEANVDLTVEHAYRIGRFLGWYYGREHKCAVVIGKDTRRSSYMFENALSSGLTASGADAYAKIRAGASAVQFYSAMVYEGPGLVTRVKRDLAARLRVDGFTSVAQAVGAR